MAGIFGSVSKKGDCAKSLYYGVDYHCHLGTDYAGLAVFGEKGIERKIHDIRGENFRPKFQQDYAKMKGKYGIGVIGYDIQPIVLSYRHGVFSLVMNGNIANLSEIVAELQSQGSNFAEIQPDSSISPAEVMAEIISKADTIELGIESIFNRIQRLRFASDPHQQRDLCRARPPGSLRTRSGRRRRRFCRHDGNHRVSQPEIQHNLGASAGRDCQDHGERD